MKLFFVPVLNCSVHVLDMDGMEMDEEKMDIYYRVKHRS